MGEVDLRSKDGEGEDANRRAALSQKAAPQMPFPATTPPVKMQYRSVRRRSGIALFKIFFPLMMRKAKRSAFKIVVQPAGLRERHFPHIIGIQPGLALLFKYSGDQLV